MSGDRYKINKQESVYFLKPLRWSKKYRKVEGNGCCGILSEKGKKTEELQSIKFWKEDNHAIELDCTETEMLDQKINYIHDNPLKEGIVNDVCHYLSSSAVIIVTKKAYLKLNFYDRFVSECCLWSETME